MPIAPAPSYDTEVVDSLPGIYTTGQAAAVLGVTRSRVRQMVDLGRFQTVYRVPGESSPNFFDAAEVDAMAEARA